MQLIYETTKECEFKIMYAFNYYMEKGVTALEAASEFDIYPMYIWQEYARFKAKKNF